MKTFEITITILLLCVLSTPALSSPLSAPPGRDFHVPILLYHRLGPTVADSMTITTRVFESHLDYLRENGYQVIPLRQLVDHYLGKAPAPRPKSVVIVADDAHRSVYTQMLPLARKYRVPVTVFAYPSAVSNASYAMTWEQLRELKRTGLFDIQSHTYWHPNFRKEKKKLTPAEYERFVNMQMKKSKEKLEKEVGGRVDLIAWPFGLGPDRYLMERASAAGYLAGFTIERHAASPRDSLMQLPRFLLANSDQGTTFAAIVKTSDR